MKPHIFHPEAAEEYAEAARYYAAIQPELAGRFYDAVEEVIRGFDKNRSAPSHDAPRNLLARPFGGS